MHNFYYVGTQVESEGLDRRDMSLPGYQLELLQDAVKYGMFVICPGNNLVGGAKLPLQLSRLLQYVTHF